VAELRQAAFKRLANLIYNEAGICLGDHKQALVSARLGKRLRFLGIEDYDEYYDYVIKDHSRNELSRVLDAISTNVTYFFREPDHFDFLTSLVQKWESIRQKRFRLWSAACSTGEEPYTMALTLSEALRNVRDVKILATDISVSVLEAAKRGEYEAKKLEKLPEKILSKYFSPVGSKREKKFRVDRRIKKMIQFSWLNLSTPPYPMKGPFDVIFCRNVMIYFDRTVKKRILQDMHRLLKPGGFLIVGHAEGLSGIASRFISVKPSVYIKQ
jgi:chemotaxis protein methyltransferase CheR